MCAFSGGSIAVSNKARFRRSTLLSNDDYNRILEQTSVNGVAACLSKTSYASVLEGIDMDEIRRSELEFTLSMAVFREGVGFRPYLSPAARKILDLWLENFDIALFKGCFRTHFGAIQTGSSEDDANKSREARMVDMISEFNLTLIDQEKLFAAQTLRDLTASIINEKLRDSVSEALPRRGEEASDSLSGDEFQNLAFSLGMILDRYFSNGLYAMGLRLQGTEGRFMRTLMGTRGDLLNLYWIYRGRNFFGMSPEQTLTLVSRVRFRIDFDFLTKMAFAPLESWGELLADTPYAQVFSPEENKGALREAELGRKLYRVLERTISAVFMSGSPGYHNVGAYLMLKEFEVKDLISMIEAVRYGFDRKKMNLLLIRNSDVELGERQNSKGSGR